MNLGVDMTFPLVFHQKELEVSFPGLNAGGGGGFRDVSLCGTPSLPELFQSYSLSSLCAF